MRTSHDIIYDLNNEFAQSLFYGGCFAKKLKQLHDNKNKIIKSGDISNIRSNAVQFKLLKQEWRDYLKTKITKAAIQNKKCSRSAIQNLQRELFGVSQSTKKIGIYLDKNNRNPARIQIIIDPDFKIELIRLYIRYENELDTTDSITKQQKLLNLMRAGKINELVKKGGWGVCPPWETVFDSVRFSAVPAALPR